jgi:hypothetical protein
MAVGESFSLPGVLTLADEEKIQNKTHQSLSRARVGIFSLGALAILGK